MSLEKIPAILLTGLGLHIALTPPTPATPKSERRPGDGPVDINWITWAMKAGYWISGIIELCIIVAGRTTSESTWSKRVQALLLPNGKPADCIRLTPTTTFAVILMVLGSGLRYWCFREMGRHFTFHVTLLKDHKLVTTGPYSIIRHPAYTGGILLCVGEVMWYAARGSWLRESMIYQTKLSWLLICPVLVSIFLAVAYIPRRIPVEDASRLFPGMLFRVLKVRSCSWESEKERGYTRSLAFKAIVELNAARAVIPQFANNIDENRHY